MLLERDAILHHICPVWDIEFASGRLFSAFLNIILVYLRVLAILIIIVNNKRFYILTPFSFFIYLHADLAALFSLSQLESQIHNNIIF